MDASPRFDLFLRNIMECEDEVSDFWDDAAPWWDEFPVGALIRPEGYAVVSFTRCPTPVPRYDNYPRFKQHSPYHVMREYYEAHL